MSSEDDKKALNVPTRVPTTAVKRPDGLVLPTWVTQWSNGLAHNRVTIYVLLPSGLDLLSVTPKVVSGGHKLAVLFKWPTVFLEHATLNSTITNYDGTPRYPMDLPKMFSLYGIIQEFKKSTAGVPSSTCWIDLPIVVDDKLEISVEGVKGGYDFFRFEGDKSDLLVLQVELVEAGSCKYKHPLKPLGFKSVGRSKNYVTPQRDFSPYMPIPRNTSYDLALEQAGQSENIGNKTDSKQPSPEKQARTK